MLTTDGATSAGGEDPKTPAAAEISPEQEERYSLGAQVFVHMWACVWMRSLIPNSLHHLSAADGRYIMAI